MDVFVTDEDGNQLRRTLVDDEMPDEITVFCDGCQVEFTADYIVCESMPSIERLEVAREHMRMLGWRCDGKQNLDLCPDCKDLPGIK